MVFNYIDGPRAFLVYPFFQIVLFFQRLWVFHIETQALCRTYRMKFTGSKMLYQVELAEFNFSGGSRRCNNDLSSSFVWALGKCATQ